MDKLPAILSYLGVGLTVGIISATLGIGGGVLLVPALLFIWACSMHTAIGTSLAVIAVGSLAAATRHFMLGNVDLPLAAALAVGTVVGSFFIGAPLAEMLPGEILKKIFGVLLVVVGLRMIGLFPYLIQVLHIGGAG
ncbi:MAG: sulfite exporter TauE/SafE family protein [Armatimonadetes bacterium]|nr:sulfite exporter TauE/SafE family protein [Armatimonadota bacterium]